MLFLQLAALSLLVSAQALPTPPNNPNDPPLVEGEYGDLFEGDIVLTKETRNGRPNKKWFNGVVYYTWDSTVDAATQRTIQDAIAEYHSKTCIRWVKRSTQIAYINFHRPAKGCNSRVGMIRWKQTINLGRGCNGKGTIIHEMMHALGFHHEQNREDRDQYVTINWNNIQEKYKFAFYIARGTSTFGQPYDYSSVMHYHAMAFSSNGGYAIVPKDGNTSKIGGRTGLSKIDVNKLNAMYGCSGGSVITTQRPVRTTQHPVITTQRPVITTQTGGGSCADNPQYATFCRSYVQHNLCQQYAYFTKVNCKQSCKFCTGTSGS